MARDVKRNIDWHGIVMNNWLTTLSRDHICRMISCRFGGVVKVVKEAAAAHGIVSKILLYIQINTQQNQPNLHHTSITAIDRAKVYIQLHNSYKHARAQSTTATIILCCKRTAALCWTFLHRPSCIHYILYHVTRTCVHFVPAWC